jgi:hypothetical protein
MGSVVLWNEVESPKSSGKRYSNLFHVAPRYNLEKYASVANHAGNVLRDFYGSCVCDSSVVTRDLQLSQGQNNKSGRGLATHADVLFLAGIEKPLRIHCSQPSPIRFGPVCGFSHLQRRDAITRRNGL